jgi:FkbM family methyltransferase
MYGVLAYIVLLSRKLPFLFDHLGNRIFLYLAKKNYEPGIVKRNNKVWYLGNLNSIVERALFLETDYDKPTVEFIEHFIKEGFVCIDVGANIGFFTALLSEKVGENGKVFAFEASPIHFQSLKKNMELNEKSNYQLFNTAIGDTVGLVSIYTMSSTGSLVSDFSDFGLRTLSKDQVQMNKLDNLFQDVNIHFIKIDVDGNELQVLKGANRIIKELKPMICIEICERTQNAAWSSAKELLIYLKSHGYKFFLNCDNEPVSIEEVLKVSEERQYIDILCK